MSSLRPFLIAVCLVVVASGGITSATAGQAWADDLRVVTYNIHSGLGGRFALWQRRAVVEKNLEAIAKAIVAATADGLVDVVGLNEVDFASRRSSWVNEAQFVADALERTTGQRFTAITAETWRRGVPGLEVSFGNAILVRHPVLRSTSCLLDGSSACGAEAIPPTLPQLRSSRMLGRWLHEPRGLIRATLDVGGREVDVLLTHLDAFVLEEREAQATHLIARFVTPARTTVLLGDTNAVPAPLTRRRRFFESDRTYQILTDGLLADARAYAPLGDGQGPAQFATFPASAPLWPLDGVFGSRDLRPRKISVIGETESDHRGLFVEYVFNGEPRPFGPGPVPEPNLEPASWRPVSPTSLAH